ncbi:MAG: hypothetical protein ACOX34_08330 [Bacillota bacterium]
MRARGGAYTSILSESRRTGTCGILVESMHRYTSICGFMEDRSTCGSTRETEHREKGVVYLGDPSG